MHGRRGQPQSGVDVYGNDRVEKRFVGVQCKGKEQGYGHTLTKIELRKEVEKAKTFRPPLEVFIVATTAVNDVEIQALARKITEEHKQVGLFEVRVQAWDTLRQRITDYSDLVTKHFPDFAPYDLAGKIDDSIATTQQEGEQTRATIDRGFDKLLVAINERPAAADPLQVRIGEIAKLMEDGYPQAALSGFENLWTKEGARASPRNRYRLQANIGSAHLIMGETDAAVRYFRAAHMEEPDWAGARAILATAELIDGNLSRAYDLAKGVLIDDSTSDRAAAVLLEAAPTEISLTDLEALIPQELKRRFDIVLNFAIRARKTGNAAASQAYAERAFDMQPEDWRTNSVLAETLLEPIFAIEGIALTRYVPAELQPQLDRALGRLREAWAELMARDDTSRGIHVAANFISALDLAGLESESERVLDQALKTLPSYPPILRRYAQKMAQAEDWSAAAKALSAIPAKEAVPEDRLFRIQMLSRKEDSLSVLLQARQLLQEFGSSRHGEIAATMLLEAAAKCGRLHEELSALLVSWPNSILIRFVALTFIDEGDPLRPALLSEIDRLVSGISDPRDRFYAAEALFSAGAYAKAAELYEGLHGDDKDTIGLRRHLQALHYADRRREARQLFDGLTDELKVQAAYTEMGVAIYERSGMLSEARSLLERVLASQNDLHKRLQWAGLCERLGDSQTVIQWLMTVTADQQGQPRDLMALALAIDRKINDPKCLPIAYRALRAGYSDPQIHLSYTIGLFIEGQVGRGKIVAPAVVEPNSAVLLIEKDGEKRLTRILETEPAPQIERDEIAPTHLIAQQLMGLKQGDEIEIGNVGVGPTRYVVAEIRNKYLHAHFRSLERFETLFPENRAFGTFKIDESKGDEKFKPIFDSVKRRGEFARQLQDVYRSGSVPLAMIAKMAGTSPFDVWEAFLHHADLDFQTALGVPEEYAQSDEFLRNTRRAIIDPVTLYGLVRLGIAAQVRRCFEDLGVVQATVDTLRMLVNERRERKGVRQGTLGWDGEHYHMVELSDAENDRQIANAEAVLAFASELTLVPAEAQAEIRGDAKHLFEDMEPAYLDTVFAALGDQRVLLCDDRPFRALSLAAAGVGGVWTQAAARFAARDNVIPLPDYLEIVGTLAETGYAHATIGPLDFLFELRKSGWIITRRISKLVEILARPTVTPESLRRLLADLALLGWREKPDTRAYKSLMAAVLKGLANAQPQLDLTELITGICDRVFNKLSANTHKHLFVRRLLEGSSLTPVAITTRTFEEPAGRLTQEIRTILYQALAEARAG
ncbi:MAG: PIN domain-containing protein [Alphaproteobacteria bacterium]